MPLPPRQPSDFNLSNDLLGSQGGPLNNTPDLPTRQGQLPSNRPATSNRKLMHWLIPDGPMVQMYMNPQSVRYNFKKDISQQRTKGGFLLQYWGPGLTNLEIEGTTGTSGIEGINVLRDVYENEQLAFDPVALAFASKKDKELSAANFGGLDSNVFSDLTSGHFVQDIFNAQKRIIFPTSSGPTLASLAFQVELYWSGEVYRGFFTGFVVTESVTKLGFFDYTMSFVATQRRGFRQNFLAWHRSPTAGPSHSDPNFGAPYSFSSLI